MQIPSFMCSGTTVVELREFNDKIKTTWTNAMIRAKIKIIRGFNDKKKKKDKM